MQPGPQLESRIVAVVGWAVDSRLPSRNRRSRLHADNPWEHIAMADTSAQLTEGSSAFRLVFKGADIAKSGRDGPYVEDGLLRYL